VDFTFIDHAFYAPIAPPSRIVAPEWSFGHDEKVKLQALKKLVIPC
jgi:hypothetical protein